jgi:hypothetical protein
VPELEIVKADGAVLGPRGRQLVVANALSNAQGKPSLVRVKRHGCERWNARQERTYGRSVEMSWNEISRSTACGTRNTEDPAALA